MQIWTLKYNIINRQILFLNNYFYENCYFSSNFEAIIYRTKIKKIILLNRINRIAIVIQNKYEYDLYEYVQKLNMIS